MNIETYLLFVAITGVFLLSPGPSVMLAINNGVKFGIKFTAIATLGNVLAFQLLIILSALGLGAALTASADLFNILKIIGALYLVYLGLKIWFSPVNQYLSKNQINIPLPNPFALFKQAFLVTASNPKALVYVSALIPQFINTNQPLPLQIAILGLTSAIVQFAVFLSYGVIASKSKCWFESTSKQKLFNKFSGLTFIGFGVALGVSENKI